MMYSYNNNPYSYIPQYYNNYYPCYTQYPTPYLYPINYQGLRTSEQAENINVLKDHGPNPFVFDIEKATISNNAFRTAVWTGKHLQITLMSIKPGECIGLEVHPNTDQFLRVEAGDGVVHMGDTKDNLNFKEDVHNNYAIVVPAGKWHNVFNTGSFPLKVYSIYAPAQHPKGTIHQTKADAIAAEDNKQLKRI